MVRIHMNTFTEVCLKPVREKLCLLHFPAIKGYHGDYSKALLLSYNKFQGDF